MESAHDRSIPCAPWPEPPTDPRPDEGLTEASEALLERLRAEYDQGHMQPWHENLAAIEAAAARAATERLEEPVARALYAERARGYRVRGGVLPVSLTFDDLTRGQRDMYRDIARAALAAPVPAPEEGKS